MNHLQKLILLLGCTAAASGFAQKTNLNVSFVEPRDGKEVILTNLFTSKSDTLQVKGNGCSFTDITAQDGLLYVRSERYRGYVITHAGDKDLQIKMDGATFSSTGSAMNDSLMNYVRHIQNLEKWYTLKSEGLTKEQKEKLEDEWSAKMENQVIPAFKQGILLHKSSTLSAALLMIMRPYLAGEDYIKMYETTLPLAKKVEELTKTYDRQKKGVATSAGKTYLNVKGENAQGAKSQLSDFVGKGKIVLLDFWASWCGPCRAGIPKLVEIYAKDRSRGLEIVGINVWDKKDPYLKAVKSLNMSWPTIFDENSESATTYGIVGVPTYILLSEEGKILHRSHGGAELYKAIESALSSRSK